MKFTAILQCSVYKYKNIYMYIVYILYIYIVTACLLSVAYAIFSGHAIFFVVL